LANRLEQLVQFTANRLLEKEHVWDKVRELPGTGAVPSMVIDSHSLISASKVVRLRLTPAS
jgi:hypothetical protein